MTGFIFFCLGGICFLGLHNSGAPNDQFVVKCIIIPPLMKINVIKASSRVF